MKGRVRSQACRVLVYTVQNALARPQERSRTRIGAARITYFCAHVRPKRSLTYVGRVKGLLCIFSPMVDGNLGHDRAIWTGQPIMKTTLMACFF